MCSDMPWHFLTTVKTDDEEVKNGIKRFSSGTPLGDGGLSCIRPILHFSWK
jgi:hypothetical protein